MNCAQKKTAQPAPTQPVAPEIPVDLWQRLFDEASRRGVSPWELVSQLLAQATVERGEDLDDAMLALEMRRHLETIRPSTRG